MARGTIRSACLVVKRILDAALCSRGSNVGTAARQENAATMSRQRFELALHVRADVVVAEFGQDQQLWAS